MKTGASVESAVSNLIIEHMPYARNVAAQTKLKLKLPIEMEDAIQSGYEGLVVAAGRFTSRPDLDAQFKSYAYWRIRGSVIDETRRMYTSRSDRRDGYQWPLSLDVYGKGECSDLPEPLIQIKALERDLTRRMDFDTAMESLSDRERYVVLSRAVGAYGREIAEELGVSIMRISQIASEACYKMCLIMEVE